MASTYPTTADSLVKVAVDNPDLVDSVAKIEATEIPRYTTQTIAYAATITPDPTAGEIIAVGALTGNITIANPTAGLQKGRRMLFKITQDGTGSRTVTWGNAFKVISTAVDGTASKISTVEVVYDGTNWLQVGGVPAVA